MSKLGVRLYGRMPGCDSEEVSSILTPLTILVLLLITGCGVPRGDVEVFGIQCFCGQSASACYFPIGMDKDQKDVVFGEVPFKCKRAGK